MILLLLILLLILLLLLTLLHKHENDYLGDTPEHLKELMQTKGIHRELLDVRFIKAATKNLKLQFLQNLICVIVGALLPILYLQYTDQEKVQLGSKLLENQADIDRLTVQLEKHCPQKDQPKQILKERTKSSKAIAK